MHGTPIKHTGPIYPGVIVKVEVNLEAGTIMFFNNGAAASSLIEEESLKGQELYFAVAAMCEGEGWKIL